MTTKTPVISDSVTTFGPGERGRAALAGSHAGLYAAYLAAKAGVKAVILNDAGVGREQAGIGGLRLLEQLGVPGAAIGHRSARIGDGADGLRRGVLTYVNGPAAQLGLHPRMSARVALDLMAAADLPPSPAPPPLAESRHRIAAAEAPGVAVWALDSASLVTEADKNAVVIAGSHGAVLGGRPQTALKADVFAGIFNDADVGIDDAGISRLPALAARGIAAATVSAWSARIGDGLSIWQDGYVSALNERAIACGAEIGISAAELVRRLVAARTQEIGR
jgi:hypothetical protein